MSKKIKAISFMHKGERILIKAGLTGRFRVPVTYVLGGAIKTKMKNLTARQFVDHEIIKHCDPTLYLEGGEKIRVFHGGDPSYLPAQIEGIIIKHDNANKIELPKWKKKIKFESEHDRSLYHQANFDMYSWWPSAAVSRSLSKRLTTIHESMGIALLIKEPKYRSIIYSSRLF